MRLTTLLKKKENKRSHSPLKATDKSMMIPESARRTDPVVQYPEIPKARTIPRIHSRKQIYHVVFLGGVKRINIHLMIYEDPSIKR
jgi:hypothetical protein